MNTTDPIPDARLRDDIAQELFANAMGRSEGLGDLSPNDRRALLEPIAAICFEAAEVFIRARRSFAGSR